MPLLYSDLRLGYSLFTCWGVEYVSPPQALAVCCCLYDMHCLLQWRLCSVLLDPVSEMGGGCYLLHRDISPVLLERKVQRHNIYGHCSKQRDFSSCDHLR